MTIAPSPAMTPVDNSQDLSSQALHLLRVLRDYQGRKAYCWPSQKRLANDMRLSLPTVKRLVRQLKDAGVINVERQGLTRTNHYSVVAPEVSPMTLQEVSPMTLQEVSPMTLQEVSPVIPCPPFAPIVVEPPIETAAELAPAANAAESAAAAFASHQQSQQAEATKQLIALGMTRTLAARQASISATLALAVAGYCRERFADQSRAHIERPIAFMQKLFQDPGGSGFEKVNGVWTRPPPGAKKKTNADLYRERQQRQVEEARQKREAAARTQEWHDKWAAYLDAMPAAELAAMCDQVRAENPLLSDRVKYPDDGFAIRAYLMRQLEDRKGGDP